MSDLLVKLMYREASNRMADSSILAQSVNTRGDSAYLLNLLALEILLKCALLINEEKLVRGHKYSELFEMLPKDQRDRIVSVAAERLGPTVNYSDLDSKLNVFSSNFIKLRYPYESYKDLTEEEYFQLGDQWMERGAIVEEAEFKYYPEELYGLQYALSKEVEAWLANQSPEIDA